MLYQMLHTGREICISKKKDIHISLHKRGLQPERLLGSVRCRDIKEAVSLPETAEGDYLALSPLSCKVSDCTPRGRLIGYIEVADPEAPDHGQHSFLAVYRSSQLPLFLLLLALLFCVFFMAWLFGANRPRDMPQPDSEVPVEDTHAYEDEPVPIEAGGEIENVEAGGNVSFNAYSGVYRLGEGEPLPLTNLSGNTVYLRYTLKDKSGREIFSTGLIGPGMQYDFVASDFLAHGSTDIALYAECYAMDQTTKYPGSCRFDITIIYE